MADWSALAALGEAAGTLELVLLSGPDLRGEEGLKLARAHLPSDRRTRWFYLDEEGPEIAEALVEQPGAVVLAHGLEYMPPRRRARTEESLNLLRDMLAGLEGILLLWVPRSGLEDFRVRCADLFQWRSLLMVLGESAVPLAWQEESRRRYLVQILTSEEHREFRLVEPEVEGEERRVQAPAAFDSLLPDSIELAIVYDYPAQSTSDLLLWLAARMAQAALRYAGPTPVVDGHELVTMPGIAVEDLVALADESGVVQLLDESWVTPGSDGAPQRMMRRKGFRLTVVAVHPGSGRAAAWRDWAVERTLRFRELVLCAWDRRCLAAAAEAGDSRFGDLQILELTAWLGRQCIPPFASAYFEARSAERMRTLEGIANRAGLDFFLPQGWFPEPGTQVDEETLLRYLAGGEAGHVDLDLLYRQAADSAIAAGLLRATLAGGYEACAHPLWSYYAAQGLLSSTPQVLSALRPHLDDPRWQQVLVMIVAHVSRTSSDRESLWVQTLWPLLWPSELLHPVNPEQLRRMSLALEAAVDADLPPDEIMPWAQRARVALVEADAASPGRDALVEALARTVLVGVPAMRS